MSCVMMFFFFKQKTAYEMRISDWSSDVCSADLIGRPEEGQRHRHEIRREVVRHCEMAGKHPAAAGEPAEPVLALDDGDTRGHAQKVAWHVGRASRRERVCQSVEITGVPVE